MENQIKNDTEVGEKKKKKDDTEETYSRKLER